MRRTIGYLGEEAETAIRVFYSLKEFRLWVSREEDVKLINKNPHFWRMFDTSVRTHLFICIRRLYEGDSNTFNFQQFINLCVKNVTEFSGRALRDRKVAASHNANEWIDEYMINTHQPTIEDFYALSRLVRENSKRMKGKYTEIASQVYAHAVHTDDSYIAKISEDLSFDEMESALTSIWHCYRQFWEMFENGRKPNLEIAKYPYQKEVINSLREMLDKEHA